MPSSRALLLLLALLVPVGASAGSNAAATAEQSRQVTVAMARVAQVEELIADAEARVEQLEEAIRVQGQSQASRLENIDQVNAEVSRLRGQIEVLTFDLAQLEEAFEAYQLAATRRQLHDEARLRQIEQFLKIKPPPPPTDEELGLVASEGDEDETGSDASSEDAETDLPDEELPADAAGMLALARGHADEGRHAVARAILEKALGDHAGAAEAPEMRYRLGETWFAEEQWRKAAALFRQVMDQHGSSKWAPWSMLRVGQCFAGLDQRDNAKLFFEGVTQSYPKSDAAKEAKRLLAQ